MDNKPETKDKELRGEEITVSQTAAPPPTEISDGGPPKEEQSGFETDAETIHEEEELKPPPTNAEDEDPQKGFEENSGEKSKKSLDVRKKSKKSLHPNAAGGTGGTTAGTVLEKTTSTAGKSKNKKGGKKKARFGGKKGLNAPQSIVELIMAMKAKANIDNEDSEGQPPPPSSDTGAASLPTTANLEATELWEKLAELDAETADEDESTTASKTDFTTPNVTDDGVVLIEPIGFDEQGPLYSKMRIPNFLSATPSAALVDEIRSTRDFESMDDKVEEFNRIYGDLKRRTGEVKMEHGDLPEPDNLYDALQSNFLKTIIKSYLYRLVLTGTHKEDTDALIDWMQDLIEHINVHCYSEPISGVLLIYPNHFIHVLEGSEDTLMKFMKVIADQFEPTGLDWKLEFRPGKGIHVREPILFTTVKTCVLGMFQIQNRGIASGWKSEKMSGNVQMTHEEVPPGGYREKLFQFTKSCCIMGIALYKLNPLRYGAGQKSTDQTDNVRNTEGGGLTDTAKARFEEVKQRRGKVLSKIIPKPPMIDYIIKKDENRKIQLRSLREHLEYFWKIPPIVLSQQTDWPVPGRIAPYD